MLRFWNKILRLCILGEFINFFVFLGDDIINGDPQMGLYRPIYLWILGILFILSILGINESEKYWRRINGL